MNGEQTSARPGEMPSMELAQADSVEAIGRVDTIKGSVFITRTDGTRIKAESGQEIFQGDVVETDAQGAVGLVFADDSTFSLAEGGQMTIDEMVYDAGSQQGNSAITVAEGVFTFVSGQIAKTAVSAMVVNTPTATIGIRGTSGGGKASPTKGDTFSLFEDADGTTGEMTISTEVGSATLNTANQTTRITSKFALPSKPVVMPASAVQQFYGAAIAAAPPPPTSNPDQQGGGAPGDGGPQGDGGGEQAQEGEAEQAADGEAGAEAEQQLEGEAQLEGGELPPEGQEGDLPPEGAPGGDGEQLADGPGPEGPGPGGPGGPDGPEGDNIEAAARAAAEQAVQQALTAGGTVSEQAVGEAALAAAIAEARASGISEAEIQAGAGAFQDALAGGGSLDDAFEAAMSAGEAAGVQAAVQFDQAIQQAQQQGAFGPGGPGPIGGAGGFLPPPGSGPGGGGGDTGGGNDGGGAFGGESLFGGDPGFGGDFFGDPFGNPFGDPFGNPFGDPFGEFFGDPLFGDPLFDPFAAGQFQDFADFIDDFPDDDNINTVAEDTVLFGEEFINTSGNDTFAGNIENTEYRYDQSSNGGTTIAVSSGGAFGVTQYDSDVITDDGGLNDRLTFESLDQVAVKMSVSSTAGFMDFHIYNEFNNTSSLSTVLTYIQVETTVEDIQGSVDTLGNLDAGIIVSNAMDLTSSETAYIMAGGASDDTMTMSDSNAVGALLFGKGGNDTITGSSGTDEVIYGGGGNDVIDGKGNSGGGGDSIFGGLGSDTINVTLAAGQSSFDGGDADDTLDYSSFETTASFVIGTSSVAVDHGSSSGATANNFETVIGSTGADTFTFSGDSSATGLATIDGNAGNDTFTFSANSTVAADIDGAAGNDTFVIGSGASISGTLDGGTGTDVLSVTNTSVSVSNTNFEAAALQGSSGNDTLNLASATVSGLTISSVAGGGGTDTLAIASGVNVSNVSVSGVETITDSDGTDSIALGNGGETVTISGIETITGGTGTDSVTLSGSGETIRYSAVETMTGTTGDDNFYLLANGTYTIDGGSGTDYVRTASSLTASLYLTNVEQLPGTAPGPYNITLLNTQNGLFMRGSGNTDTLTLADGGNTVSVYSDVDSVVGGTGADNLTVTVAVSGANYNLAGGSDSLTLSGATNTFTASNIETITGGTGADTITLGAAQGSGTIDGGAGSDTVNFANGTNSVLLENIETIVGGTGTDVVTLGSGVNNTVTATNMETISGGDGNDTISLGTAVSGGRMSGGGGTDIVNLANGTNDIDFFGVETITGGTGADTITGQDTTANTISAGGGNDTITGSGGNDYITGGTGADRFVFSGQLPANLGIDTLVDFSGVTNFSGAGGEGDKIVLDTSNLGISSIGYAEVVWDGSSSSINAGSANVVVLHSAAGTAANAAAALAAGDASATDAVILFSDSANSNQLTMMYTSDLSADGTESTLAVFDSITNTSAATNLDTADFIVQA